ncbi:MAG: prepilin-type N-terminal cleavage/methylation domain-containing protein [Liquorilactobacillus sp.]|uniref:prepilin-type N-terminal cleavage/methylation domain-containing protein n=1 Tax=Liquorilactobacillus sp. TaxID=2767923 RepID=UPI0039EC4171
MKKQKLKKLSLILMKKQNKEGFTLVEVMAVLSISVFMLLISIHPIQNKYNEIAEGIFWEKFDESWMRLVTIVPKSGQKGNVYFYNDKAIFVISNQEKKYLYYPQGLHLYKYQNIQISASGRVKADTVVFNSEVTKLKYIITFQLAWGDYRIKKEKN